MNSFFSKQNKSNEKGKVFAYNVNNSSRGSDYFERNRSHRLIQSYNVPMKNQSDQYIDVVEKDSANPLARYFKFLFGK